MNLKLLTRSGTIFDRIIGFLFFLASVILALGVLIISVDVVLRYFVRQPLGWVIEVVAFSLLFITFLGAAWVLRIERHVKVDLVLNLLNPGARAALNITTSVLGGIMCLLLAWYSGHLTWDLFQSGERTITVLEWLKAPLVAVIPLGSFLLSIQFLRRAYAYLVRWRRAVRVEKGVAEEVTGTIEF